MSSSASTPFQAKLKKWFSKALGRNNRGSGINTDIRNNNHNNKKRNTATSDPGSSSGKPGETSANRCYCCDSAAPMRCELDAEFPAVLRRGRRCSSCLAAVTSNPRPNTFEAYGSSPHQTSTPRSVTLSSPESAYGSGNSEDGVSHLSCSLSRTSDCRCFRGHLHHKSTPAALHRQHKHSCAGGARLSQHNPEDSGIILDDSAGNGKNGGGRESRAGGAASSSSSGAAERPKIRTNPWVSFSGSQQQLTEWFAVSKTQSLAASSAAEFQRRAARYSSSASLVMTSSNSSHNNSNKQQQGANKISRLPGESAVTGPAATSGVNFVRGTVATKSLTIPASTGLSGSAGFTKLQQQQGFPSGRTRVAKRTLDCPRCLLMAKQVPMSCLDCYRDKSWESQLCAYCRSWLLAEGDSTPDVNSDSDYNDADTSSSSLSVIFDTSNNNNNNNNSSSSRLMMSTPLREIVKQPPVVEPRLYQQNPHHHHLGKPPLHDHQRHQQHPNHHQVRGRSSMRQQATPPPPLLLLPPPPPSSSSSRGGPRFYRRHHQQHESVASFASNNTLFSHVADENQHRHQLRQPIRERVIINEVDDEDDTRVTTTTTTPEYAVNSSMASQPSKSISAKSEEWKPVFLKSSTSTCTSRRSHQYTRTQLRKTGSGTTLDATSLSCDALATRVTLFGNQQQTSSADSSSSSRIATAAAVCHQQVTTSSSSSAGIKASKFPFPQQLMNPLLSRSLDTCIGLPQGSRKPGLQDREPFVKCRVDLLLDAEEEEEGGVSGSVSGSVRCLSAAAGTAMMMTTTSGNKLGTYSTLEDKLNQLRLERRLLEAKIRDAVEEDQLKFVTGWKPRSVSVPRHVRSASRI